LTDRQTINRFLFLCLFNLLALSPLIVFAHTHYSGDTYSLVDSWAPTEWYIGSFRYFAAAVTGFISIFSHNPILNPTLDIVCYIVIASIAASLLLMYLNRLLESVVKSHLILFLIIQFSLLVTVVNVWYTNILTFPECIAFDGVGLFLCFLAVVLFAKSQSVIGFIVSSAVFVCSAATFQQYISIFFIYSFLIVSIKILHSKYSVKQVLLSCLKTALFFVINCALYYLIGIAIQKIMHIEPNPRASMSLSTVLENIKYFIGNQHSFLKGRGFFSTEILTISYIAVAIAFVISLVIYWIKTKETVKSIVIGMSFIVAYAAAYLPGLVSTSHGTRTICALFSVFALFSIGAIALYRQKALSIALFCIVFLVFALNIYKTVDMGISQIIGNTKEAIYADSIAYEIEKYEKASNEKIDTVSISYDQFGDAEAGSLYERIAVKPLLQSHIENEVMFTETPEKVYREYFAGKDWKSFDPDEQIVFDKNVAHICVY